MDKKKIIKEYKEKINLLKNYNEFYYEKSKPIVSDKDYKKSNKVLKGIIHIHSLLKYGLR